MIHTNAIKKSIKVLGLLLLFFISNSVFSQNFNQFGQQYIHKPYLAHPSMLMDINQSLISYSIYTSGFEIDGAPTNHFITGAFKMGKKLNIGFNWLFDERGIFSNNRILGTFSYHLKFNKDMQLYFGASVGMYASKLLSSAGGATFASEPLIPEYNEQKGVFDGDIGATLIWKKKTKISLTFVNLKNYVSDFIFPEQSGILNLSASYQYVKSIFTFLPFVNIKIDRLNRSQFDIGSYIDVKKQVSLVLAYQLTNNSFLSGISLKRRLFSFFGGYQLWLGTAGRDLGSGFELGVEFKFNDEN